MKATHLQANLNDAITAETRDLLVNYSGIPPEEIMAHVRDIVGGISYCRLKEKKREKLLF